MDTRTTYFVPYRITLFELGPPTTIKELRVGYADIKEDYVDVTTRSSIIDGTREFFVYIELPDSCKVVGDNWDWVGNTVMVKPNHLKLLFTAIIKKEREDGITNGIEVNREGLRIEKYGRRKCYNHISIPDHILRFKKTDGRIKERSIQ